MRIGRAAYVRSCSLSGRIPDTGMPSKKAWMWSPVCSRVCRRSLGDSREGAAEPQADVLYIQSHEASESVRWKRGSFAALSPACHVFLRRPLAFVADAYHQRDFQRTLLTSSVKTIPTSSMIVSFRYPILVLREQACIVLGLISCHALYVYWRDADSPATQH